MTKSAKLARDLRRIAELNMILAGEGVLSLSAASRTKLFNEAAEHIETLSNVLRSIGGSIEASETVENG